MINRDSAVLWLGLGIALVGYLTTAARPPVEWSYMEWLQFVSFLLAWVAGKLSTSPLKGENDDQRVGPGARMWWLPIILVTGFATAGCLPKTVVTPQPPVEDVQQVRAKAVQIAKAVESTGNLIVEARRATGAAHDAGLITTAQRNAVYQAVIDLEPKAHALIDVAATVTTTPELRSTVQVFIGIVDDLLAKLGQGNSAMASTANAIRTALDVVFAFIGGDR